MKYLLVFLLSLFHGTPYTTTQTGISAKLIEPQATTEGFTNAKFPGGEEKLYEYLSHNIRYPYILVKTEMEGEVELKFKVTDTGIITDTEIIRGFDPLADNEVIRVVKSMPAWQPAQHEDENADAEQKLIISFTLNDELKELAKKIKDTADENSYIQHPAMQTENKELTENVDNDTEIKEAQPDPGLNRSPEFPGGQQALEAYLKENMRYPKRAIKYGISGRSIFKLQISPEGEISKIWIFKSLFPDCDEEGYFLIKKMPKWIPGLKDGKPATMEVMLPIAFELPK